MFTRAAIAPAEARRNDTVHYLGLALLIVACGIAAYLGGARECRDATPAKQKPPITRSVAPTVMV